MFFRICYDGDADAPLFSPCLCNGSLKLVHHGCLQQYLEFSHKRKCEICKLNYIMKRKSKPFSEVSKL